MAAICLDIAAQRRHLKTLAVDHQRHRTVFYAGRYRLDARRLGALNHHIGGKRRRQVDIDDRLFHQRIANGAADDPHLAAIGVQQREDALQRRLFEPVPPGKAAHE